MVACQKSKRVYRKYNKKCSKVTHKLFAVIHYSWSLKQHSEWVYTHISTVVYKMHLPFREVGTNDINLRFVI